MRNCTFWGANRHFWECETALFWNLGHAKSHLFICEISPFWLLFFVKWFFYLLAQSFLAIFSCATVWRRGFDAPGRRTKEKNAMTLTEPIETGRRFNFPPEPLQIPADQVKSVIERIIQQMPQEKANAALAAFWFLNVQAFRSQEEKFMVEGEYEASLPDHRAMLANLIADGEAIVFGIKKFGLGPTDPMKFTVGDLQATLNSLHSTFNCEYGPKNSKRTNQMIKELFDGSES